MSIRAIDTQMMVTRSADMVREASPLMKNPETFQSQLANMGKQEAVANQHKVQATTESEMENIRTDEDGSGNGAAGGGGFQGEEESEEFAQSRNPELKVGDVSNSLIDITV